MQARSFFPAWMLEVFMGESEPPKNSTGNPMRAAGSGFELAASIGGMCLIGYWIDRHFDSGPWGILICAAMGITGGLYNLIRRSLHESLRTADKKSKDDK